jgi:hypothetical protein
MRMRMRMRENRVVRRDPSGRGSASIVIALAGQIASHNLHAIHLIHSNAIQKSMYVLRKVYICVYLMYSKRLMYVPKKKCGV